MPFFLLVSSCRHARWDTKEHETGIHEMLYQNLVHPRKHLRPSSLSLFARTNAVYYSLFAGLSVTTDTLFHFRTSANRLLTNTIVKEHRQTFVIQLDTGRIRVSGARVTISSHLRLNRLRTRISGRRGDTIMKGV